MNTLQEYAEVFERLGLTELHAEDGECRLTLRKETANNAAGITATAWNPGGLFPGAAGMPFPGAQAPVIMQQSTASAENDAAASAGAEVAEQPRRGEVVKAPLLGIYHERGGDRPLKAGDKVYKGEALCTIEAMKMMNEVASPRDGVVSEILVSEGALVEYHQELFVIE